MAYTTIDKPSDYFNTKLYTGTGSSNALTGINFQPDFVWIKRRNSAGGHMLTDVIRGVTKTIITNETSAEQTFANGLTAFGSDGFTVGSEDGFNKASDTFASWNWLASNTTASNTDGSITSTVSANTTSGFSIVSWTGSGSAATIGHGLGATPKCIIVKNRTDSVNWFLYNHSVITAGASNKSFMTLNTTDALGTNGSATTFTSVSSTTFGVGTDNIINGSSDNMIAYVFAEKKGYSKFGSYTGNGNADGTFVYTGFKPAFVIYKRYDSGSYSWVLVDNKRNTFNAVDKYVHPDLSAAEGTVTLMDFLSNGFKMRVNDTTSNQGSIIYMAFAENPFVSSSGICCTAR